MRIVRYFTGGKTRSGMRQRGEADKIKTHSRERNVCLARTSIRLCAMKQAGVITGYTIEIQTWLPTLAPSQGLNILCPKALDLLCI